METRVPKWLEWAREIQALCQTGLTYSKIEYDIYRYKRLMEIATEIVENYTQLPKASLLPNFLSQQGYATPKVDVRGAVVRDGKVLLVQERADSKWSMPGGWADVGEVPSAMVAREVWEESGFRVKVEKVIGVYDANHFAPLELYHAYKIIFMCTITGGEARPSNETLAADFFDLNHLPPLSTSRTNQQMLEEVFAQHKDPTRATAFD